MSDAMIFSVVFVGIFVLRIIAATIVFFFILPPGDRCPMCDAPTLRLKRTFWSVTVPSLRPSWCMQCGWEGMLRTGPVTEVGMPAEGAAAAAGRDE